MFASICFSCVWHTNTLRVTPHVQMSGAFCSPIFQILFHSLCQRIVVLPLLRVFSHVVGSGNLISFSANVSSKGCFAFGHVTSRMSGNGENVSTGQGFFYSNTHYVCSVVQCRRVSASIACTCMNLIWSFFMWKGKQCACKPQNRKTAKTVSSSLVDCMISQYFPIVFPLI